MSTSATFSFCDTFLFRCTRAAGATPTRYSYRRTATWCRYVTNHPPHPVLGQSLQNWYENNCVFNLICSGLVLWLCVVPTRPCKNCVTVADFKINLFNLECLQNRTEQDNMNILISLLLCLYSSFSNTATFTVFSYSSHLHCIIYGASPK